MPVERAGYTVSVYAIDVSPSMGELVDDAGTYGEKGRKKPKLDLAKEFVARKCEPKISSGRKTEAVGILSFGGHTNNEASRAYYAQDPDGDSDSHAHVSCDVAIQTAKPRTLEEVVNLEVGEHQGNPVSALMVALDMIHTHKHTKSWMLEIILVTDGESAFSQDDYEDAMTRLDELGVKLTVLGIGFQPPDQPVDKSKSRNKRLSEKFWRTFIDMLYKQMSQATSSEEILPSLGVLEDALAEARLPRCAVTNGTVSPITLYIGSAAIDSEQAIAIPIKYSKATMKARPPTLSKSWKPAVDVQAGVIPTGGDRTSQFSSSQLMSSMAAQSQQHGIRPSDFNISADVKNYSTYVIKRPEPQQPPASGATASQPQPSQQHMAWDGDLPAGEDGLYEDGTEDEVVQKEDIVKAWRFGSTWVPMEQDTFEPLHTEKGVEILGFFPIDNIKRHHLMGEVRFVWPDTTTAKSQIQFSSLVEGMHLRRMCAVVRWVTKENSEPALGICVPDFNFPGDDKRLDYMFWCQIPFAEDEHNFWFPSLTTYKTTAGKVVETHPLLPTEEQCDLMDELVEAMDLDAYAKEKVKEENEDDEVMEEEEGDTIVPWLEPINSYNPVIHRIKEAVFHASLVDDLKKDPVPPPHPELTKFFHTPEPIVEKVADVTERLKDALDIKKVPLKVRQKKAKEALRDDEGYIDIDDLFDDEEDGAGGKGEAGPSTPSKGKDVKAEPESPWSAKKGKPTVDEPPSSQNGGAPPKPKKGRLVSNERPLDDFNRLIEGEGDVFRKAMQDLGAVVKENIAASFSRQAFPLALDCLRAMRTCALTYEEVETYNEYIEDLEKFIKAPSFKHKDFWERELRGLAVRIEAERSDFEKAGESVRKITAEEAQQALEAYE